LGIDSPALVVVAKSILRYNLEAMALKDLVIRSQLIPPRQPRGVLHRPRLEMRLESVLDYPLTIVQAGTGYGKSTALTALSAKVNNLAWYTITEPDRDPLLFLAHLICAFEQQDAGWCEPALNAAEESGGRVVPELLTPLLNGLTLELDDEAVLILDDYHVVDDVLEIDALVERLVDYIPPRLHVVIASRQMPPLNVLTRWRVKGQVLIITRDDLAFTAEEVETLFLEQYDCPLSSQQAQALTAETEGWAIALQMVWQSLQSGAVSDMDDILGQLPTTLETLFDYLAQDVLARQSPTTQRFLLTTSVLRQIEGTVCEYLLDDQGSADLLRQIHESGLFLVSAGTDVYRYHRLFHDFLQAHLNQDAERAQALHRRAAEYYQQIGHLEETVYHLLEARDYPQAARLLQDIGPRLVTLGRFDSLSTWIARLPKEIRKTQPGLNLLMGDVLRLRAHFDGALEHYIAAEHLYLEQREQLGTSRALRGQAQVYLDTVRPLKADSLLEEALRLLEPEEHRHETAALLERLAENKLNLGYPDEARALHHEARLLRAETDPGEIYLEARAMVRTGRLTDAQRLLEERAEKERQDGQVRPQRFHRETLLLLSLVHALQGQGQAADRCAREGIAIGEQLGSPFVEAVGYMRLGHAVQLRDDRPWKMAERSTLRHSMDCYQRAIEQVQTFKVMRTQVEPLWGLVRACSYHGDLTAAEQYAEQSLNIVRRAGDEWMQNLVQVTMGAGYALAGRSAEARPRLTESAEGFGRVGDLFGQSAAWLWLALDAWWQGDADQSMRHLSALLPLAKERSYDPLLVKRTFIGLKSEQAVVPLLVKARMQGIETHYAGHLLSSIGLGSIETHPGYCLAVRSLGPFAVWRGDEPVAARDWQREKARQIFQLLLTYPRQWFYREQIIDHLWPHLPPHAAERDFKVALNALNRALEPNRPRGASPFFVVRRGSVYGLNPEAQIVVDANDFEQLAASDEMEQLRQALALYEDDYLPDSLYEDWSAAERQRLRHLYLVTAERLARHLLQHEDWEEAIRVCQMILARDNCWEAAYRLLMRAYAAQDNRPRVHSVYQQCVTNLHDELGVEPAPATQALFEQLS
jgi:ATP/maltotriose-dependent transcriptional regulator MalT/DNA-binding SARP family transcriptional activator